jgi:GTP-binding protein
LLNQYLKRIKTPQILLFNKIDLTNFEEDLVSYYNLLRSEQHFFISTLKGTNLDNLIEKITIFFPSLNENVEKTTNSDKKLNLLIFGAPNSGKSTLMNYLLQEDRSLVTPIAGTTQEPVTSS